MAEVLLFHHVQGLTPGVHAFADTLRGAGHVVHVPDLFDGRTFADIPSGMEFVQGVGFEPFIEHATRIADELPDSLVYAGFSFGVVSAQKLAQTRAGARGALFFHGCADPAYFGSWPQALPAQIHTMDHDPEFEEGDLEAARSLVATGDDVELFVYPGNGHLFADNSLADYDEAAATLLMERTLAFLERVRTN